MGWFVITFPWGPFQYRKPITIDYTKVGCSSGVTNFPALISLSGVTEIKTTANGGHVQSASGYDITFRASDGVTVLDHEVENYNGSAGTLAAWVRVPVLSGTTNTVLYMYYGNSSVSSPTQNPTGVWDSNFKGVWHLNESPADNTTGGHKDSTANVNNGTPRDFQDGGGGTTNAIGIAAGANDYGIRSGADDRVEISDM